MPSTCLSMARKPKGVPASCCDCFLTWDRQPCDNFTLGIKGQVNGQQLHSAGPGGGDHALVSRAPITEPTGRPLTGKDRERVRCVTQGLAQSRQPEVCKNRNICFLSRHEEGRRKDKSTARRLAWLELRGLVWRTAPHQEPQQALSRSFSSPGDGKAQFRVCCEG